MQSGSQEQAKKPGAHLRPRKAPSQQRAAQTVDAILQAAAEILERSGLEGYNTNDIAVRAGVSIGSLYQYFPNKDAITVAMIERETVPLVQDVRNALNQPDRLLALRSMIAVAVRHQLHRPRLSRLLDFEQNRLAAIMPTSSNAAAIYAAIYGFLDQAYRLPVDRVGESARDIMSIIRVLTDAAGERGGDDPALLQRQIEGAVSGYLSVFEKDAAGPVTD